MLNKQLSLLSTSFTCTSITNVCHYVNLNCLQLASMSLVSIFSAIKGCIAYCIYSLILSNWLFKSSAFSFCFNSFWQYLSASRMGKMRTGMLLHGVLNITIFEVDKLYGKDWCNCFPKVWFKLSLNLSSPKNLPHILS